MNVTASCESFLLELAKTLDPNASRGLEADIQFVFSGTEESTYYLHIADGKCTLQKGESQYPRLTIRVNAETWQEIQSGKIPWTKAMMERKFLATGNFPLLARLPQLFKIG
jgi:putative sterol carrier protein